MANRVGALQGAAVHATRCIAVSPVQPNAMGLAPHLTGRSLGVELDRDQVHPRLLEAVLQGTHLRVRAVRRHRASDQYAEMDMFGYSPR